MLYRSHSSNFYDTNYRSDIFNQNNVIFSERPKYSPETLNLTMKTPKKVTQFCGNSYDPSHYYNNSSFSIEQKKRIALKKKNLPEKEKKEDYGLKIINYRKYGSIFDNYKQNFRLLKKKKEIVLNNSANYSFHGHTPKELTIMMNQSNIFYNKQKDDENKILTKIAMSRSANVSPKNKVVKGEKNNNENNKQATPKFYGRKKLSLFETNASVIKLCDNKKLFFGKKPISPISIGKTNTQKFGTIHNYELKNVKDYNPIDFKQVQKLFNKNGINIFGVEYHDNFSYGNKQNCILKVREGGGDPKFNFRIKNICQEINKSPGIKINEINPYKSIHKK